MFCKLNITFSDGCRDTEVFSNGENYSVLEYVFSYILTFEESEIESFEIKFISEYEYSIMKGI